MLSGIAVLAIVFWTLLYRPPGVCSIGTTHYDRFSGTACARLLMCEWRQCSCLRNELLLACRTGLKAACGISFRPAEPVRVLCAGYTPGGGRRSPCRRGCCTLRWTRRSGRRTGPAWSPWPPSPDRPWSRCTCSRSPTCCADPLSSMGSSMSRASVGRPSAMHASKASVARRSGASMAKFRTCVVFVLNCTRQHLQKKGQN